MAERLTDNNGVEFTPECSEVNPLLTQGRCPFYDKLEKLEDILEKYGVDIQNLDYILEDYSKNQGRDFAICEERDTLRQERDTWKRACELACKWFKQTGFIGDQTKVDYFYQQAKKEK